MAAEVNSLNIDVFAETVMILLFLCYYHKSAFIWVMRHCGKCSFSPSLKEFDEKISAVSCLSVKYETRASSQLAELSLA